MKDEDAVMGILVNVKGVRPLHNVVHLERFKVDVF
jgi:hypothetical protein